MYDIRCTTYDVDSLNARIPSITGLGAAVGIKGWIYLVCRVS